MSGYRVANLNNKRRSKTCIRWFLISIKEFRSLEKLAIESGATSDALINKLVYQSRIVSYTIKNHDTQEISTVWTLRDIRCSSRGNYNIKGGLPTSYRL